MNGEEGVGVESEIEIVTMAEIANGNGTEIEIGSIEDLRNVDKRIVVRGITGDTDQGHARGTRDEGHLDEISATRSICWRPSNSGSWFASLCVDVELT